ncbi:hypothetical protein CBS147352_2447 [Aspergillus niger]|nr:hypothetical protein CBS147352_2447 [Aspergillus niger]
MSGASTNEANGDPHRHTCLVPYVDPDTVPPDIQAKLKVLPFRRNILLTLAHSNGLFPHFSGLLGACFDGNQRSIPVHEWQLIVLRVGTVTKAKYEIDVNKPVAEVFGFPQEKFNAIGCSIEDVMEEQLSTYDNKRETVKDALKLLSVGDVVEVLMIIGVYALLARVINGLKVDEDEPIPDLKEKIKTAISG